MIERRGTQGKSDSEKIITRVREEEEEWELASSF
jgi:hypothetical protein